MTKSMDYWLEEIWNKLSSGTSVQLQDENGLPYGIKQIDNKLRVVTQPYLYAIAEGEVTDHDAFRRFGTNADVGTTIEILAPIGGTYYWPATAGIMHVVSTDTDDVAVTGTGARTLWIQGLDAEYDVINETVSMNGTTVVNTTKQYLRVLQTRVVTVGTSGVNEGTITIKDATDTYTLNSIPIGEGRSNYAVWTVPDGATAYITEWHGSENSSKGCEFSLWFRWYGRSWEKLRMVETLDSNFEDNVRIPFSMPAKTDIMMRVIGLASGAKVAGGFVGWWEY